MTAFDRFQWQNAWIDDPRVPCELISVLAVLFRYINAHGTCYPSQVQIANHLQKTVRTVQRRLTAIEDLGYLERSGGRTFYRARTPLANTTPMSPDTTPMSPQHDTHVACTGDHTTPMSPDTTPMTPQHDTHVALTVQEQSKEQSSSSSLENELEVLEKQETEKPLPQPPAVILAELCESAGLPTTVFQARDIWDQVRVELIDHEESAMWDYFRWKLSDLQDLKNYDDRAKRGFLRKDVSTWLDQKRKQNVGRNNFPASTAIPNEPMVEPEPQVSTAPTVSTDAAQHARQVWGLALTDLQTAVSRKNYTDWIAPLTPIGIEQTTLHLDAGDGFKAVYTEDTYRTLILDALTAADGEVDAVKFHPEFII